MTSIQLPPGVDPGQFFFLLQTNISAAILLLPPTFRKVFLDAMNTARNSTRGRQAGNETGLQNTTEVILLNQTTVTIIGQPDFSGEATLIKIYAYVIIITSIIGILGNSLVMGVYGKRFKELNICKLLILHLAASDFIFSILQIAVAAPSVNASDWPYGEGACKFLRCCILLGSLTAVGTMLIIAVERYLGIMHSMKFSNGALRVGTAVVVLWICSLVSVVPPGIALVFDVTKNDCEEQWNHGGLTQTGRKAYDIFLLVFWFVFPMCIIGFCYMSLINLLRKPLHKRGFASEASADFAKKRRKEDIKVIKTLVAVVLVFFVCCLPIRIMWIIFGFIDINSIPEANYFALLYTGLIPYPLHVAVNPLIYSIVDNKFRKEVRKILNLRHSLKKLRSYTSEHSENTSRKTPMTSNVNLTEMASKKSIDEKPKKESIHFTEIDKASSVKENAELDDSVIIMHTHAVDN